MATYSAQETRHCSPWLEIADIAILTPPAETATRPKAAEEAHAETAIDQHVDDELHRRTHDGHPRTDEGYLEEITCRLDERANPPSPVILN